jgi:hypothetical protein
MDKKKGSVIPENHPPEVACFQYLSGGVFRLLRGSVEQILRVGCGGTLIEE